MPFLGVRRPAPGRVGEGLHHSPIRHSRLVGGRDDPANPVEMTPLAPVARIRIEPENVGCAYPFRDLLESRSTRIRVNDKDRRLARTERVYELRACSMLCRRRRARVRIGLVGDVEPKDLSLEPELIMYRCRGALPASPGADGRPPKGLPAAAPRATIMYPISTAPARKATRRRTPGRAGIERTQTAALATRSTRARASDLL